MQITGHQPIETKWWKGLAHADVAENDIQGKSSPDIHQT